MVHWFKVNLRVRDLVQGGEFYVESVGPRESVGGGLCCPVGFGAVCVPGGGLPPPGVCVSPLHGPGRFRVGLGFSGRAAASWVAGGACGGADI